MDQVKIEERTEIEGVFCPFSGGLCRMNCRFLIDVEEGCMKRILTRTIYCVSLSEWITKVYTLNIKPSVSMQEKKQRRKRTFQELSAICTTLKRAQSALTDKDRRYLKENKCQSVNLKRHFSIFRVRKKKVISLFILL